MFYIIEMIKTLWPNLHRQFIICLYLLVLQGLIVCFCFQSSIIVPLSKKQKVSYLNDFKPVALTSVIMKTFEHLVLSHLKTTIDTLLDPMQFVYRANRSVCGRCRPKDMQEDIVWTFAQPSTQLFWTCYSTNLPQLNVSDSYLPVDHWLPAQLDTAR